MTLFFPCLKVLCSILVKVRPEYIGHGFFNNKISNLRKKDLKSSKTHSWDVVLELLITVDAEQSPMVKRKGPIK